jgi:hypothetical protein
MGGKLNGEFQLETSLPVYVMILLPHHGFNPPPPERRHAVVAFDTVDISWIFEANNYQKPGYDDTITGIMVV